jgi:hypothetical protein
MPPPIAVCRQEHHLPLLPPQLHLLCRRLQALLLPPVILILIIIFIRYCIALYILPNVF